MSRRKEFKKKLENLVKDETGSISKDKVIKIGLGTISALGMLSSFSSAGAGDVTPGSHSNHNNAIGDLATCVHSSHSSHSSY